MTRMLKGVQTNPGHFLCTMLNTPPSSKPKGVRLLGYMGHLMLISEDVITALARFSPDLRLIIIQYAPEPEWDQYVTGRYNETKEEDAGKTVVVRGRMKVDENDLGGTGGGGAGERVVLDLRLVMLLLLLLILDRRLWMKKTTTIMCYLAATHMSVYLHSVLQDFQDSLFFL